MYVDLLGVGIVWNSLGPPDLTLFSTIQFSSQPASDSSQQLQQALEERAQLETHVEQVRLCRGRGMGDPR